MRAPDWPERMAEIVAARRHVPFQWGAHDCAMFAFDVVAAITGTDPGAEFRGRYDGALGAARLLDACGGLRSIASARWPVLKRATDAQRGDVVCVAGEGGRDALAVVVGRTAVGTGPDGLVHVPMSGWLAAWRVA